MGVLQSIMRYVWNYIIFRFVIVGVVNTIFGYSLFSLFVLLGVHYSIATLFATIIGVLFNFRTTGRLVFQNKNIKLIFRFLGVYVVAYFVNVMGIKILTMNHIEVFLAGAILALPIAFLSFVLNKKFVFEVEK